MDSVPDCGGCGHPFGCHGDRAVAACVPEEIRSWISVGGTGVLAPLHHKCYCTGWRPGVLEVAA